MAYFYLISALILNSTSNVLGALYNRKNENKKDSSQLYTLILVGSVFVFWLIKFLVNRQIETSVLWHSFAFAFFYVITNVGLINALKTGNTAITSLFLQLSLICVAIWGVIFWNSKFSFLILLGLILVVFSLFLCLWTGKEKNNKKLSIKWIIFSIMMLCGNAGCCIVQKTQQMKYNGQYGDFFMLVATSCSIIVSIMYYLKSNKTDSLVILKQSFFYPVLAGVCNGVLNLFIIFLATSSLSPSLIYPLIAVGSLVITSFFSAFIFKEKMFWWQWIGVVVGMIAVALLSL